MQFNNENKKWRQMISGMMNGLITDKTISPYFASELVGIKIQNMLISKNKEEQICGIMLVTISFLDGYKKLNRKIIDNTYNIYEWNLWRDMNNLKNLDPYFEKSKLFETLPYFLTATYEFEQMPGLGKRKLQQSLSELQVCYLEGLTFLNINDQINYTRKLTGSDYLTFYENMLDFFTKGIEDHWEVEDIACDLVNLIVDYLCFLSIVSFQDFQDNIEEMMDYYYKWSIVLLNKKSFKDQDTIEELKRFVQKYYEFYQQKNWQNLIHDRYFLIEIVDSFISFNACQYDDTTYCFDNVLVKKKELDSIPIGK